MTGRDEGCERGAALRAAARPGRNDAVKAREFLMGTGLSIKVNQSQSNLIKVNVRIKATPSPGPRPVAPCKIGCNLAARGRNSTATGLQSVARNCTKLHQIAPNCTKLHQIAPNCTKLHQIALDCGQLRLSRNDAVGILPGEENTAETQPF
jgi:hypothetical protein